MNDHQDDPTTHGREPQPTTTLVLNAPFVERVGEQGVAAYVEVIEQAATTSRGRGLHEVADELQQAFESRGIVLPDMSYQRTAEQLTDPERGEVVVVTNDGRVLSGPPGSAIHEVDPVVGTSDPEDPDRPVYS